jgi:hypothetical protein
MSSRAPPSTLRSGRAFDMPEIRHRKVDYDPRHAFPMS